MDATLLNAVGAKRQAVDVVSGELEQASLCWVQQVHGNSTAPEDVEAPIVTYTQVNFFTNCTFT